VNSRFTVIIFSMGILFITSDLGLNVSLAQIGLDQNFKFQTASDIGALSENSDDYIGLSPRSGTSILADSSPDSAKNATEYDNPNLIPYRTRKSIAYHILALPATTWRLLWYPLGKTAIWIDQNNIHKKAIGLFLNNDFSAGIFPIMNIGGNMGFAPGLMAFHNNLFDSKKSMNFSSLFASLDNNYTTLTYSDKSLFGSSVRFDFSAHFISDSEENHFIGGNNSTKDDKTYYDVEQGKVQIGFGYNLIQAISWQVFGNMKHIDISQLPGDDDPAIPTDIPGFGTTKLWGIGTEITFDLRNGWPRTLSGTLIKLGYQRLAEMSDDRFLFHYYALEAQQFMPIPFLAKNRRLSVRGRLENRKEISGENIPFYELSMLGDSDNLRGFDQNRFRAKGSVLFNFEYRYPIWDTWDAVIFLDEGQVFDGYEEITFDNFHWAAGAGLRLMTKTGFLLRIEVGYSNERVRALFELSPNF